MEVVVYQLYQCPHPKEKGKIELWNLNGLHMNGLQFQAWNEYDGQLHCS